MVNLDTRGACRRRLVDRSMRNLSFCSVTALIVAALSLANFAIPGMGIHPSEAIGKETLAQYAGGGILREKADVSDAEVRACDALAGSMRIAQP